MSHQSSSFPYRNSKQLIACKMPRLFQYCTLMAIDMTNFLIHYFVEAVSGNLNWIQGKEHILVVELNFGRFAPKPLPPLGILLPRHFPHGHFALIVDSPLVYIRSSVVSNLGLKFCIRQKKRHIYFKGVQGHNVLALECFTLETRMHSNLVGLPINCPHLRPYMSCNGSGKTA